MIILKKNEDAITTAIRNIFPNIVFLGPTLKVGKQVNSYLFLPVSWICFWYPARPGRGIFDVTDTSRPTGSPNELVMPRKKKGPKPFGDLEDAIFNVLHVLPPWKFKLPPGSLTNSSPLKIYQNPKRRVRCLSSNYSIFQGANR